MKFSSKIPQHPRLALGAALAGTLAAITGVSLAGGLDPTLPHERVVGPPRAAAAAARVNAQRDGATEALPGQPKLLWKVRAAPLAQTPLLVDSAGVVVVTTSDGSLIELSPSGQRLSSTRVAPDGIAAGPVLLSDGTRALITIDRNWVGLRQGKRHVQALNLKHSEDLIAPTPTDSGGLALASGPDVVLFDARGNELQRADIGETVRLLLADGPRLLVVTRRGVIHSWSPPGRPQKLGSFPGRLDFGAALSKRKIIATLVNKRLVEFDLKRRRSRVRAELGQPFANSPAVDARGRSYVVTKDGRLYGHDASGKEFLRLPLESPMNASDGGTWQLSVSAPAPIIDQQGRVAFIRPGLNPGVVDSQGNIHSAQGASCPNPIDLAPAGQHRFAVLCESGHVFLLGAK